MAALLPAILTQHSARTRAAGAGLAKIVESSTKNEKRKKKKRE
jgi:hypothetical protein